MLRIIRQNAVRQVPRAETDWNVLLNLFDRSVFDARHSSNSIC